MKALLLAATLATASPSPVPLSVNGSGGAVTFAPSSVMVIHVCEDADGNKVGCPRDVQLLIRGIDAELSEQSTESQWAFRSGQLTCPATKAKR
jgi:hypothetical protein